MSKGKNPAEARVLAFRSLCDCQKYWSIMNRKKSLTAAKTTSETPRSVGEETLMMITQCVTDSSRTSYLNVPSDVTISMSLMSVPLTRMRVSCFLLELPNLPPSSQLSRVHWTWTRRRTPPQMNHKPFQQDGSWRASRMSCQWQARMDGWALWKRRRLFFLSWSPHQVTVRS